MDSSAILRWLSSGHPCGCTRQPNGRKRKRFSSPTSCSTADMAPAEDVVSLASSNTSLSRIILQPKPPSQRKSRSPSPARKQLARLEQAVPPIRVRQPGSLDGAPRLESVSRVRAALSKDLGDCSIPSCFKERLREIDSDAFDELPSRMFDDTRSKPTPELDALWLTLKSVYFRSMKCWDNHKDENAWAEVVLQLLNAAVRQVESPRLEVNSIQSQGVDPELLPHVSGVTLSRKADFALGFSPFARDGVVDETCKSIYHVFNDSFPDVALGPMQDAYTSRIVLSYAVELKEPGGDANEANIQLAVLQAAMLRKLCHLSALTGASVEMPSLVGWTVVGHKWECFITSILEDGSVICQGPFENMHGSTAGFKSLFILWDLLQRACRLADETLWPVVRNILSGPESEPKQITPSSFP